jgi:hypothetical protein
MTASTTANTTANTVAGIATATAITLLPQQPVYDALANPNNPALAKAYNPPMFKYRFDVDPKSDLINIQGASVVGAIMTSASPALKNYANTFIFGVSHLYI